MPYFRDNALLCKHQCWSDLACIGKKMMQVQHSTRELTIQERKKLCDLLDREEAVFDAREHARRVELVQSVGFCRILQKLLELTKNTFAQIAIAHSAEGLVYPRVFPAKNALRH